MNPVTDTVGTKSCTRIECAIGLCDLLQLICYLGRPPNREQNHGLPSTWWLEGSQTSRRYLLIIFLISSPCRQDQAKEWKVWPRSEFLTPTRQPTPTHNFTCSSCVQISNSMHCAPTKSTLLRMRNVLPAPGGYLRLFDYKSAWTAWIFYMNFFNKKLFVCGQIWLHWWSNSTKLDRIWSSRD